jgi:transposase InsO family protein
VGFTNRGRRCTLPPAPRSDALGMQEILTAPQSPWQNPYAERLIGSIRRECLNHYIILNARHLKRTLSSYFRYYHESRTHLSLGKQCPFPREALKVGKIVAIPQLGDLHYRMNALQHSNFCSDRLLANDNSRKLQRRRSSRCRVRRRVG